MTKTIQLTQNKVALIDDEDFDFLNQWKWYFNYNYAKRTLNLKKQKFEKRKSKIIYMHRVIVNAQNGQIIDHINGNTLDNRKSNLRVCTHSQNLQNSKIKTGKYKGVSWHKSSNKWLAKIGGTNSRIHIGLFSSKEEAALAYNEAALKYYGEFARLNEIHAEGK